MKKIFLFTSLFVFSLLIWSPKVFAVPVEHEIANCDQLQNIVSDYPEGNFDSYKLTADFSCDNVNGNGLFVPIDWQGNNLFGVFDGNNHTISDLNIDADGGDAGIFISGNGATVKDLTIDGATITNPDSYNGILFGYTENEEVTTIQNVHITGLSILDAGWDVGGLIGQTYGDVTITDTTVSGVIDSDHSKVGGLIGGVNQGVLTISNTSTDVTITGDAVETEYNGTRGGLLGYVEAVDVNINNCYSTGNITGESAVVGGLIGFLNLYDENSRAEITNSYSTSNINGYDYLGGLIGVNQAGEIYNSYASGNVVGGYGLPIGDFMTGVGGLVGVNGGHIENTYATGDVEGLFAGGLVGFSIGEGPRTIINSYATGNVTGSVSGGLVGVNEWDHIYNSYSTGNVTGQGSESFEIMKVGMVGEGFEADYITGGFLGMMIYPEGESVDDYIFNSGWYKSRNNSELSGIGMVGYSDDGIIFEGPAKVTYTETNNRAFYDKDHGVYDQTGEYAWGFNGNPWYEYSDNYPKFTEPQGRSTPGRSQAHSSGSGSSPAIMASFQAEQLARALAVGADTTPYLNGTPTPSTGSTSSPQASSGQVTRTLKQGMTGDDVKSLQTYLNIHGYDCGLADGVFGLKTKQAVIKFQIANGLVSDGIVGPMTRALLK